MHIVGVMIIKNSPWSRRFLTYWWKLHKESETLNDQTGFEIAYKTLKDKKGDFEESLEESVPFADRVIILAPDFLNSNFPASTRQQKHNQGNRSHYSFASHILIHHMTL
jgi:hypothetical protein